ncbi:MAG: PadR family transcriptional regulator [Candidatus Bathyarchaeota archaeon]|nr:PadR family transcriptional regulator [Candidatus Bathyarchaeota archaeon]
MLKTKSLIPRGFTRLYVLKMLKEKPLTGKEIIDEAEKRSDGLWKPSPGLIYPLLGRLLAEGLIEEIEGGRFKITTKGEKALEDYEKFRDQIENQIEVLRRLGLRFLLTGKVIVEEVLDRMMYLALTLRQELERLAKDKKKLIIDKYKDFLRKELERLEKEQT